MRGLLLFSVFAGCNGVDTETPEDSLTDVEVDTGDRDDPGEGQDTAEEDGGDTGGDTGSGGDTGEEEDTGGGAVGTCPPQGETLVGCRSARAETFFDGTLLSVNEFQLGADGMPTTGQLTDADGQLLQTYAYSHNAAGFRTAERYTNAGKTAPTLERTWTYTRDGQPLEVRYTYENDAPSDRVETYNYDADGRLVVYVDDKDGDGTTDFSCDISWSTTEEGETALWRCETITYQRAFDERGLLVIARSDLDGSGRWYFESETSWRDDCRQGSSVSTIDDALLGFNAYDRTTIRWGYDADGRLVSEEQQHVDDNVPAEQQLPEQNVLITYEYTCP